MKAASWIRLAFLVAAASPAAQVASWPQFGGPTGDFRVPAAPIVADWGDGPSLRWSRDLGEGFSGIAVTGDALFTMYRRGDEEVVVSLDPATGRTRWEHAATAPPHKDQDFSQGPGPHATPLVTGDVVCAVGSTARLRCLEVPTGRLLWSRDLVADEGATVVYRGYSSSPIARGDAVIVQAGGAGRAVIAFDRRTGKRLWRSGDYANTNSSPALIDVGGQTHLVVFMADIVAGFDPDTGSELWSHPHPQRFNDNITRPIAAGDLVIVTSALDGGTRALKIVRAGAGWRVEERWHQPRVGVYYTNAVAAAGLILASSGGLGPTFFSALRPDTGEIAWQSRDILRSQILAVGDDRLILRDEEGGLALATVSASGSTIRARAVLFAPGAPSPPTLVGTTLYARDRSRIFSIDLARRGGAPFPLGQQWPMFRGPNASGLGTGTPPVTWDTSAGDGIRWKTELPGIGHSSPIVWGERVFITTAVSEARGSFDPGTTTGRATVKDDGAQTWRVLCLDRRTGRLIWERAAREGTPKIGRHPKASHANSTPATDGRHIVAYFGSEGLYAYDVDGRLLWSKDLGVIDVGYVGRAEYQWSTASSPIIHDGLVIIQADAQQRSFVAAFEVETGKEVWRHNRDELPSWTTPVIAGAPGQRVLVTNSPRFIRGLDPATGRELWRVADEAEVKVPTPVATDGLVVVAGGAPRGREFRAIKPGRGVVPDARVAWTAPKGAPYTPTPVVVDDLLYVLSDNAVLSCYELATGALVYQQRVPATGGSYSASPIAVGGRLYLSSEDGVIHVVRAGRTFELLASNPMHEPLMATPAVSADMLIVRGASHLFGIEG